MSCTKKIYNHLVAENKQFKNIVEFSDEAGIYALFFYGRNFPLDNYNSKENEIIYIGKTESSQKKRDADTHFKTGKTGSSTLRKTFGSLLRNQLKLTPIPRSQSDIDKGRFSHFKFDSDSEAQLTKWMVNNLGLAFYPYPKSPEEIDSLETLLIKELSPILNIDRKNIKNPFYNYIRLLRKQSAKIAFSNFTECKPKTEKSIFSKPQILLKDVIMKTTEKSKYGNIWSNILPSILECIENNDWTQFQLSKTTFDAVGNRKEYSFNLEFTNGEVSNNISGSAVARDLARVLQNSKEFKILSKGKNINLKMSKSFVFSVIV